jgi:hypothetical protein
MNKGVAVIYISYLKSPEKAQKWKYKHINNLSDGLDYLDLITKLKKIKK